MSVICLGMFEISESCRDWNEFINVLGNCEKGNNRGKPQRAEVSALGAASTIHNHVC